MIYDQDELKQAVAQGERKLAERRQRARRQKKRSIFALVLAGVALAVGGALKFASRTAPAPKAPVLVVTWPKSKTSQVVQSGQSVLAREGQPFKVSLSDASAWNVSWSSSGVQNTGDSFEWAPQKDGDLLVGHCRARRSGWMGGSSSTASHELSLRAAVPATGEEYRRTLSGGRAVWIYPQVQASGNVGWDERALSALSECAPVIPASALASKPDVPGSAPSPALWQIVSDFDGTTQTPAGDATYASLGAGNLESLLPQIGAALVRLAPDASIKWILRLDTSAPRGIVRLSFDGKRQRQAWVKRKGQTSGTPITGWEQGQWKGTVAPVTPTATPTSRQ